MGIGLPFTSRFVSMATAWTAVVAPAEIIAPPPGAVMAIAGAASMITSSGPGTGVLEPGWIADEETTFPFVSVAKVSRANAPVVLGVQVKLYGGTESVAYRTPLM